MLADGWSYGAWVVGAARIRGVESQWPAVGSKVHHSVGSWPLLLDDSTSVLECETGHRLLLQARGWPAGEATVEISVAAAAEGVEVTLTEDATVGPGTLVPQVIRSPVLTLRNTETLKRLVMLAHGRPVDGEQP